MLSMRIIRTSITLHLPFSDPAQSLSRGASSVQKTPKCRIFGDLVRFLAFFERLAGRVDGQTC